MADTNTSFDPSTSPYSSEAAADLIRQKLEEIYQSEPSALQELAEAESVTRRTSHQDFMYSLGTSGKDLATIQTEWHNYYQSLPDNEKHVVWQEFYASQSQVTGQPAATTTLSDHKQPSNRARTKNPKLRDVRSTEDLQKTIRHNVTAGGKLKAKHHLQSLAFGLGMGLLVVFIFMFGFFNEVFISPFIQPSRASASTPLIVGSNSVASNGTPEVIIPKINVQIPVTYGETSTNEATIESDLQDGVVHYPTTVMPGQKGNAAFFGHSSNNIFNPGHYKFAFVLLHTLVAGDTFYLTYNGKVYVYKVISRQIVDPSDVSVLNDVPGQTATATLITCDPPGTSLHRLIVVGQQISPDPSGNTVATTTVASSSATPDNLPGNGPTLWSRVASTGLGKTVLILVLVGFLVAILRWISAPVRQAFR
ncbi:MAG TPA: class D sortase [Candidatus Saccharimonadales bacterium]|nr:class D sortase [Candidatus Saccharimonadales bacterium]